MSEQEKMISASVLCDFLKNRKPNNLLDKILLDEITQFVREESGYYDDIDLEKEAHEQNEVYEIMQRIKTELMDVFQYDEEKASILIAKYDVVDAVTENLLMYKNDPDIPLEFAIDIVTRSKDVQAIKRLVQAKK